MAALDELLDGKALEAGQAKRYSRGYLAHGPRRLVHTGGLRDRLKQDFDAPSASTTSGWGIHDQMCLEPPDAFAHGAAVTAPGQREGDITALRAILAGKNL